MSVNILVLCTARLEPPPESMFCIFNTLYTFSIACAHLAAEEFIFDQHGTRLRAYLYMCIYICRYIYIYIYICKCKCICIYTYAYTYTYNTYTWQRLINRRLRVVLQKKVRNDIVATLGGDITGNHGLK